MAASVTNDWWEGLIPSSTFVPDIPQSVRGRRPAEAALICLPEITILCYAACCVLDTDVG